MMAADDASRETPLVRLTAAEAEVVMAHLAEIQQAGVPLAVALRTAAVEAQGARVRQALLAVATRLEQGQSLDDALTHSLPRLPSHLVELVRASTRSAGGGALLTEFVNYQRQERVLRREIRVALMYPIGVLIAAIFVSALIPAMIMGNMADVYREFQIKVPHALKVTAWIGDWGLILFSALVISGLLVVAVAWWGLGAARCRSALMAIPVIGRAWRWMEIASWARAMRLLLEGHLPLSEALRRTAEGARDWTLAEALRQAADRVDGGMRLAEALKTEGLGSEGLVTEGLWPETALAFLRHGEQNHLLPQSLESIALICDERARQRGRWFRLAFPSIVFVLVAHCLIFSYANVLRPLFDLMSKLR